MTAIWAHIGFFTSVYGHYVESNAFLLDSFILAVWTGERLLKGVFEHDVPFKTCRVESRVTTDITGKRFFVAMPD